MLKSLQFTIVMILSFQLAFPISVFAVGPNDEPRASKRDILDLLTSSGQDLAEQVELAAAGQGGNPRFKSAAQKARKVLNEVPKRKDFSASEVKSIQKYEQRLELAAKSQEVMTGKNCDERTAEAIQKGLITAPPVAQCLGSGTKQTGTLDDYNLVLIQNTSEIISSNQAASEITRNGPDYGGERKLALALLENLQALLLTQYIQNAAFMEANGKTLNERFAEISVNPSLLDTRPELKALLQRQLAQAPKTIADRDKALEGQRVAINSTLKNIHKLGRENQTIARIFDQNQQYAGSVGQTVFVRAVSNEVPALEALEPSWVQVTDPQHPFTRDQISRGKSLIPALAGYQGVVFDYGGILTPEATAHGAQYPRVEGPIVQVKNPTGEKFNRALETAQTQAYLALLGHPVEGAPEWNNYSKNSREKELKRELSRAINPDTGRTYTLAEATAVIASQLEMDQNILSQLPLNGAAEQRARALENALVNSGDRLWLPDQKSQARQIRRATLRSVAGALPPGSVTPRQFGEIYTDALNKSSAIDDGSGGLDRLKLKNGLNQSDSQALTTGLVNNPQFYTDADNREKLARGTDAGIDRQHFLEVSKKYLENAKNLLKEVATKIASLKAGKWDDKEDAIKMAMYNPEVIVATLDSNPDMLSSLCRATARIRDQAQSREQIDAWVARIGGIISMGAMMAAIAATGGLAGLAFLGTGASWLSAAGIAGGVAGGYSAIQNFSGSIAASSDARRDQLLMDALGNNSGYTDLDVAQAKSIADQKLSAAIVDTTFAAVNVGTAGLSRLAGQGKALAGMGASALNTSSGIAGTYFGVKGLKEAHEQLEKLQIERSQLVQKIPVADRANPEKWPRGIQEQLTQLDEQISQSEFDADFAGLQLIGGGLLGHIAGKRVGAAGIAKQRNKREQDILTGFKQMAESAEDGALRIVMEKGTDGKPPVFKLVGKDKELPIQLSELKNLDPRIARFVEVAAKRAARKNSNLTPDAVDQVFSAIQVKYGKDDAFQFLSWLEQNGKDALEKAGVRGPCATSLTAAAI